MNIVTLVCLNPEQVTTTIHASRRIALERLASDNEVEIPEGIDDEELEELLDDEVMSSFHISEHKVDVPPVVVTVDAGCVNQVAASFPLDVLVIDKDTDCAEEDDIITLPDGSTATHEWESAEIDAEYVANVIALADA
ncbi:hypothetical protein [Erythrobacter aureus]|uniref:Uncharacterized protein n=1 Tax=Erythrobacter aureus TaxID=2182384 RepID=A0A345YIP9_9SPHN|nr:hypothetical protein [Erythrobacter aureus]AXK43801.1 hypothetical protein DVR09_15200 [Erythrobacter aureus]